MRRLKENKMNLKVVNLTDNYAEEICKWKYEGEYCVYNYPAWSDIFGLLQYKKSESKNFWH